ncbi:hypothetical protein YC2023_018448 [Brassica napus]
MSFFPGARNLSVNKLYSMSGYEQELTIPFFYGKIDTEAYLDWEKKMEFLFGLQYYTEKKKWKLPKLKPEAATKLTNLDQPAYWLSKTSNYACPLHRTGLDLPLSTDFTATLEKLGNDQEHL